LFIKDLLFPSVVFYGLCEFFATHEMREKKEKENSIKIGKRYPILLSFANHSLEHKRK